MTDFMNVVRNRRSIRKYEEREIPEEMLEQIFEAVRWTPSWANTQCWEIVAVRDPVQKKKLRETLPPKGNPAAAAVEKAPLVLAVCARSKISGYYKGEATTKFGDWFMFDLGLATENLCLAAHHLGLGTVIVGLFDHDRAAKVLMLPDDVEVAVLVPVGFAAKSPSAPKRRQIAEFVHQARF
ncbi:MAG: nitroreductase family protein [Desulfobacterales bacterium]|nr:nitroreductase family protein [Desulfobacterales bacterium]